MKLPFFNVRPDGHEPTLDLVDTILRCQAAQKEADIAARLHDEASETARQAFQVRCAALDKFDKEKRELSKLLFGGEREL